MAASTKALQTMLDQARAAADAQAAQAAQAQNQPPPTTPAPKTQLERDVQLAYQQVFNYDTSKQIAALVDTAGKALESVLRSPAYFDQSGVAVDADMVKVGTDAFTTAHTELNDATLQLIDVMADPSKSEAERFAQLTRTVDKVEELKTSAEMFLNEFYHAHGVLKTKLDTQRSGTGYEIDQIIESAEKQQALLRDIGKEIADGFARMNALLNGDPANGIPAVPYDPTYPEWMDLEQEAKDLNNMDQQVKADILQLQQEHATSMLMQEYLEQQAERMRKDYATVTNAVADVVDGLLKRNSVLLQDQLNGASAYMWTAANRAWDGVPDPVADDSEEHAEFWGRRFNLTYPQVDSLWAASDDFFPTKRAENAMFIYHLARVWHMVDLLEAGNAMDPANPVKPKAQTIQGWEQALNKSRNAIHQLASEVEQSDYGAFLTWFENYLSAKGVVNTPPPPPKPLHKPQRPTRPPPPIPPASQFRPLSKPNVPDPPTTTAEADQWIGYYTFEISVGLAQGVDTTQMEAEVARFKDAKSQLAAGPAAAPTKPKPQRTKSAPLPGTRTLPPPPPPPPPRPPGGYTIPPLPTGIRASYSNAQSAADAVAFWTQTKVDAAAQGATPAQLQEIDDRLQEAQTAARLNPLPKPKPTATKTLPQPVDPNTGALLPDPPTTVAEAQDLIDFWQGVETQWTADPTSTQADITLIMNRLKQAGADLLAIKAGKTPAPAHGGSGPAQGGSNTVPPPPPPPGAAPAGSDVPADWTTVQQAQEWIQYYRDTSSPKLQGALKQLTVLMSTTGAASKGINNNALTGAIGGLKKPPQPTKTGPAPPPPPSQIDKLEDKLKLHIENENNGTNFFDEYEPDSGLPMAEFQPALDEAVKLDPDYAKFQGHHSKAGVQQLAFTIISAHTHPNQMAQSALKVDKRAVATRVGISL